MARRGRRTSAAEIVGRLKGTVPAKERVLILLGNLGGTVPARDACTLLRVCPAMFRKLRETMLGAAIGAIEPRPRGRPVREIPKSYAISAALRFVSRIWRRSLTWPGSGRRSRSCFPGPGGAKKRQEG